MANEDWYLFLSAKCKRMSTATQLSRYLAAATETSISSKTVYRRLHERGLYARKPAICIPLTPTTERMQNGADNIGIGHSFNGLKFSSPMNPDSVYKLILDGY